MTLRDKWDDVKHDLANSWYFRIWLLLGTVCVCVDIAAMAKFSAKQRETVEEHGLRTYLEHPSAITWPPFAFVALSSHFIHTGRNLITQVSCYTEDFQTHSRKYVFGTGTQCPFEHHGRTPSLDECRFFDPGAFAAVESDFTTQFVQCDILTNGDRNVVQNLELGYGINDPNGFVGGLERFATFGPNNRTFIKQDLYRFTDNSHGSFNDWHIGQQYGSSVWTHGHYHVTLDMSKFHVLHYQEGDYYNGWQSAGALGGFVFLVYMVFFAVMSFIAIFVTNDSRFLSGGYYKHRSVSVSEPAAATYGQSSFTQRTDNNTTGGTSDDQYGI